MEFAYAGLTLAPDFSPQYRYRLRGLQKDWESAGRSRQAAFTNLPPGNYTLELASADRDGEWGPATALAEIQVRGYLYQSPVFLGVGIGSMGLLALFAHRIRTRTLEREVALVAAERNRIARELHDTVLQSFLGAVPALNRLAASVSDSDSRTQAREAIRQLESSLTDARHTIQGLRSSALVHYSLCDVIRDFASRLTNQTGIQLNFRSTGLPTLDAAVEEQIYRIAVEALRNSVRYSGASYLEVCFQMEADQLTLQVHDDGCGFDPAGVDNSLHFGLTGMRERAASIGASLSIRSWAGLGTSVILKVPINPVSASSNSPK